MIQAIQLGLGLARVELLDEMQIRACNTHSKLALSEAPTLFLEFHGNAVTAPDAVAQFKALAEGEGVLGFQWAEQEEDRRRLWKARHDAYWAVKSTWPGKDVLATDVCVPISRLAECVLETQADIAALGLVAPIVGHVGDGNFHTSPVFDAQRSGRAGEDRGVSRAAGSARAGHGWHLHRRARRRAGQGAISSPRSTGRAST